jgi:stress response protein SCP2
MIEKVNEGVYALHDPAGQHVGYFKWILGQWKFKAVGQGFQGGLSAMAKTYGVNV